jgi:hypothetical protein
MPDTILDGSGEQTPYCSEMVELNVLVVCGI